MPRTSHALVAALLLAATVASAEELRSDEGVAVSVPEGWRAKPGKLGPSTVLAIEQATATDPRPMIVVNVFGVQVVKEEQAFQITRDLIKQEGVVVELPSGRYLRVDFDDGSKKVRQRLYGGLREKRLFYFILTTDPASFDRDAAVLDALVDGARFFAVAPKVAPTPVPEATPARTPTPGPGPTPPRGPAPLPSPPAKTPNATLPPGPEEIPAAEPVDPRATPPGREPRSSVATTPSPPPARPTTSPAPTTPVVARSSPAPTPSATPAPSSAATPAPAPSPTPAAAAPTPAVAPVASPTTAATIRRPLAKNLLEARSLVWSGSEYDAATHAAANLVDGSASKGWCSAPTARAPHRFVFDLTRTVDVARISFDDGGDDEAGFEGSAAKEVLVEGANTGIEGPWRALGRTTLVPGRADLLLDLPANGVRWLRVGVLSNDGHPTLTRLMEIRAYESELVVASAPGPDAPLRTTDDGSFRIERLKIAKERTGAALEPATVAPGDTFWVYFKPRALRLDGSGEYGLEVDLFLDDARGQERLASRKVLEQRGKPPKPPLSPFVSLQVELPASFPPGTYSVRLSVRDTLAGTELKERIAFEVKKPQ